MMIIGLSDCDIIYEMDQDSDTLPDNTRDRIITHLIKDKWIVVLSLESSEANADSSSNSYFQPVIIKRIKLYSDKDI